MKKPVEFVIAGGLGNQMFMLCAGLYFAEKHSREVKFDISDLQRISLLHPGLNVYNLGLLEEDQILNKPRYLEKVGLGARYLAKTSRILNQIHQGRSLKIQEIGFFDLSWISPKCERIEGYFQSWRYFSSLEEKPKLTIESISNPSTWFMRERQSLREKKFAAFHVRRGDFALPANRSNGILSISYFKSVAKLLPSEIDIVLFTDSPEQIRAELNDLNDLGRQFRVITPPEGSDPVESLLLMTLASHIAISNSTYSWWAATIAGPDTFVYAPTKWFELRDDPVELFPDYWIRVKSDWKKQ